MLSHVLALALAFAATFAHPAQELDARQTSIPIGGGIAGTLGPGQATAGGAINGVTGFVQGCLGGGIGKAGETQCFPVATAPANTASSVLIGGNAVGTLGPASGFLSAPGYCAGAAYESAGYTFCLMSTPKPTASPTKTKA